MGCVVLRDLSGGGARRRQSEKVIKKINDEVRGSQNVECCKDIRPLYPPVKVRSKKVAERKYEGNVEGICTLKESRWGLGLIDRKSPNSARI